MSELHAKYEDGRILWRGSNKTFTCHERWSAIKLIEVFKQYDWAEPFVRDLESAVAAYDLEEDDV